MDHKKRWLWSIGAGVLVLLIGAGSTLVQARLAARQGTPAGAPPGPVWRLPGWRGPGPGWRGPGWMAPPGLRGPGRGWRGGDLLPQAPAAPGAERVPASISIESGKLDPEALTVAQGKRLVLTVSNHDTVAYSFAIPGLGLRLQRLDPGASRVIELNTDRPGAYPYYASAGWGRAALSGTLTIAGGT